MVNALQLQALCDGFIHYSTIFYEFGGKWVTEIDIDAGYQVLNAPADRLKSADFKAFSRAFPFIGGDLQTMGSFLRRRRFSPAADATPVELALPNGDEALIAHYDSSPIASATTTTKPLVLLLHGLGGDAASGYMVEASHYFRAQGHGVLRLDLRGSGASARTSNGLYHAGISEDLRAAIAAIPESLSVNGIIVMGFSLGANVVLKYLGEAGVHGSVVGGIAISPPVDLAATQHRIAALRNRLYRHYLLGKIKKDYLNANWSRGGVPVDDIEDIESIIEFDDRIIAPYHGFKGAAHYYQECSSLRVVAQISTPALIIHARTDPWIPVSMFEDPKLAWGDTTTVLIVEDGGHVGFAAKSNRYSWYLQACDTFFI